MLSGHADIFGRWDTRLFIIGGGIAGLAPLDNHTSLELSAWCAILRTYYGRARSMVPKSGSRVPKGRPYSDAEIAAIIGCALVAELGGSRRATKTVMRWADVSDRSARSWINGESCPSSCHLLLLASRSRAVMMALLGMVGHDHLAVALDLSEIEHELEHLVERVRNLRSASTIAQSTD